MIEAKSGRVSTSAFLDMLALRDPIASYLMVSASHIQEKPQNLPFSYEVDVYKNTVQSSIVGIKDETHATRLNPQFCYDKIIYLPYQR